MKRYTGIRAAMSLALTASLVAPSVALCAEHIDVDGDGYFEAASGQGWTWDGADDMTLDGYEGGGIYAWGTLVITVNGENTVREEENDFNHDAIDVLESLDGAEDGNLTIQGDGTLNIEGSVYAANDLSIEDVTLNATGAIMTGYIGPFDGDINIQNATITVKPFILTVGIVM